MRELIEERTGATKGAYGAYFKLNPQVEDLPDRFSLNRDGVKLMVLGTIPQGGGGCFCPENVVLKSLLAHVFIEREEYLIVDMEAGLEHLGRGHDGIYGRPDRRGGAGQAQLPDGAPGEGAGGRPRDKAGLCGGEQGGGTRPTSPWSGSTCPNFLSSAS